MADGFTLAPEPVTDSDSVLLLREFTVEMVSRYYRRPATEAEVDRVTAEYPNHDLVPPTGIFLVSRDADAGPAGCVGVRLAEPGTGVLTRLYARPRHRGRGLGARLLQGAERAAADLGLAVLRLDTRADLVEARNLYAKHGYTELPPPANPGLYQDHWFAKRLG
jgi:GNAT superfamily N-acetyltransferase